MIPEWADWLTERPGSSNIPRPVVERQARLLLDTLIEMLGPLRREAKIVWQQVSEHYGRMAAARGLAAGEVVEELQHLRLLLIKHIGALIAVMRPRRAVAVFLRLNGIIDRCIAQAVVGYTDALVASLLMTDRHTQPLTETSAEDSVRQLEGLEQQLAAITSRR